MLSHDEVLDEFRAAGALLEGHFILSSGLHSSRYLQCARVLMDPKRADRLCQSLKQRITDKIRAQIDIVASPAMGGVVVGYEMGPDGREYFASSIADAGTAAWLLQRAIWLLNKQVDEMSQESED